MTQFSKERMEQFKAELKRIDEENSREIEALKRDFNDLIDRWEERNRGERYERLIKSVDDLCAEFAKKVGNMPSL